MDLILWNIRVINDLMQQRNQILDYWCSKWNNEILHQLESHFEKNKYSSIADQFTYLDILGGHLLFWAKKYEKVKLLNTPGKHTLSYSKTLFSRPAFRESIQDGHLFEKEQKKISLL